MKTKSKSNVPSSLDGIHLSAEVEQLETLAALADGRLDDSRRAEVLAQLSDDGDALDLLAEVMAISEELDQEDEEERQGSRSESLPSNVIRGPWRSQTWQAAAAIAAVFVLVILVPRFVSPGLPTPQSLTAALDLSKLPAEEDPRLPWSPFRGYGDAGEFDIEAVGPRDSFRWGVLATDLEVALRNADSGPRQALRPEFSRVMPGYVVGMYDELTNPETATEVALVEHAELQEVILPLLDPFQYRYGMWTRAAWWAAETGQMDFFRGDASRSLGALDPPDSVRDEWSGLRKRIKGLQGRDDLPELAEELEGILRRHAS